MNKKLSYDPDCLNFETQAILIFAEASARASGHFSVTGDDLFFGILHMPHTDAAQAFKECGITLERCAQRRSMRRPLMIACECAYTPYVEDMVRRSIAHAKAEGCPYVAPSDLLLVMLELLRGGDEEVDAIFYNNAEKIKMAIQIIKQANQAKATASARERM